MLARLAEINRRRELVGDVRGMGFFLGIEFVTGPQRIPATAETAYVVERMKQFGILTSSDGPHRNVIKFKPPMVFNKSDADRYCDALDTILADSCWASG